MIKHITIDIDNSKFLQADYTVHKGTCIKHQVHELSDIHNRFGGMPNSYVLENTTIHQLWWEDGSIDYKTIGDQLGMEVVTVSSILQPPGNMIPLHRDTFYQVNKKFPTDTRTKVRANVYLEDWKTGHFLQYGDKVMTHWKANQGLLWDSSIEHLGVNAGMENKYTLQISGFLLE